MLKEQDLLNWFKENNIEYKRYPDNYYQIHYHFKFKGLNFSIISYEQYTQYQLNYFKSINYKLEYLDPMWEIYCLDIDNDIDRQYDLNNFNEYINQCLEMKEGK